MSVNRSLPHVIVLPEDDANREIANGFHLQIDWFRQRQMQVLQSAGGWNKVLQIFESDHVPAMDRHPNRFIVLLIDCDNDEHRLDHARTDVPARLPERVFFLGTLSEPEALKSAHGMFEEIGAKMAADCRNGTEEIWGDNLLKHNAAELARMRDNLRAILFS